MLTVTTTRTIPAPAARLWTQLTTPACYPSWAGNHVEFVGAVPDVFGAGTDYVQKVTSMGNKNDVRWHIDQVDTATFLTQSGTAPMGIKITSSYTLTPTGDGTELTMTSEFKGAMVMAAKGMLERDTRTVHTASLDKLRTLAADGPRIAS